MYRSKRFCKCFKVKGLLLSLAAVLMFFGLIGSSIAWLITSTDPIVNVFTYGDIQIKLEETTGDRYKMTPGATLEKDPTLTVLANSEDCWLFIKIDESAVEKLSDYIDYSIADGWTALNGVSGVYYREVESSDQDVAFSVLANDQVTVKGSVTKEMLEKLNDTNYPTLTFTGYAVQRDADIEEVDTAAEAWTLISQSGK